MRTLPIRDRILRRVRVDEKGCWVWMLAPNYNGYGVMTIDKRKFLAHRVAYTSWKGDIPAGLELDHLCRVRLCVNPDHLEPVTRLENARRSPLVTRGHITDEGTEVCGSGHPRSEANVYIAPKTGYRHCRPCGRIASQAYKQRTRHPQAVTR